MYVQHPKASVDASEKTHRSGGSTAPAVKRHLLNVTLLSSYISSRSCTHFVFTCSGNSSSQSKPNWPYLHWCGIVADVRDSDCLHRVRVTTVGNPNWYLVDVVVVIVSSSPPTFLIVMEVSLPFKPSEAAVSFRIRLICAPESNKMFPCFCIPPWP